MSRNSKAKRDARRKNPGNGSARARTAIQTHAQLLQREHLLGGAGRQGDEWVMFLDGRPVARTDSAAMIVAMLRHAASRHGEACGGLTLRLSTTLRDAATQEAEAAGTTLDEYLQMLEQERAERSQTTQVAPGDSGNDAP